jgi:hypothetical protein
VEIKLLKNKAIRDELKFKQIDNEMFETFTFKFNPDILESMQDLWKNECQKEELKSVEIWKRKQSWLERYEEKYDSRNIFRKEEYPLQAMFYLHLE